MSLANTDAVITNNKLASVVQNVSDQTTLQVQKKINADDRYQEHVAKMKSMRDMKADIGAFMYSKNTDMLAQMNESWNTNKYIYKTLKNDKQRISRLSKEKMTELYRMRQTQLQLEYTREFYGKLSLIVVITLYATLLLLILAVYMQHETSTPIVLWVIFASIAVLYTILIIIIIMKMSKRRIMDWQKLYNEKGKTIKENNNQECNNEGDRVN